MSRVAVMGDRDSIYGFAAIGLDVRPVSDPAKAGRQLRALADQALQYFLAQFGAGRWRRAALAQLVLGARHAHAHLVVGDRLGVDHGDDVVGRAGRCGHRGGRCRCSGQGGSGLPATLGSIRRSTPKAPAPSTVTAASVP